MGRVVFGARRVPADAVAARSEAQVVRDAARAEAARIVADAQQRASADLRRARREGRAAGVAEAAGLLAEARARHAAALDVRAPEIADLALAVARRVVGECRALDAELVARRVVATVRDRFLGGVVVRTSPGEADGIREALAAARLGERAIAVREDAALHPGCCALEGAGGAVLLDDEEMIDRIGRAMVGDGEADG